MISFGFRAATVLAALVFQCSVSPVLLEAQGGAAAVEAQPYRLQLGDEIEIKAAHIPELNQQCAIRPDGRISLLRLSDVQAAGLTPTELARNLSAEYAALYRTPEIAVIVRSFAKTDVFVGGDVTQPGGFPLKGGMTASAALMRAGGLKESAQSDSVLVLREGGDGPPQVIRVNMDEVLAKGADDVRLQPSDVVYVPKSTLDVYVGGEVMRPGVVSVRSSLTALAAIAQAGGFKETAKTSNVLLLRKGKTGAPEASKVEIAALLKGRGETELQPFDVIWVPKSTISKANKFVDQYIRQLIPVYLSSGFTYLLGGRAF